MQHPRSRSIRYMTNHQSGRPVNIHFFYKLSNSLKTGFIEKEIRVELSKQLECEEL